MKLKFITLLVIINSIAIGNQVQAQDFSDVLRAGVDDASLYLQEYVGPFMKSFGYGMTNGWYTTAKPHKTLGIDVTFTANLAFVPDKDLFFDIPNFNSISVESGPTELPTVFGTKSETNLEFNTSSPASYPDPDPSSPSFGQIITTNEIVNGEFPAPDGIDLEKEIGSSFVPVPMVQLGIGLIKNTELKLRYFPPISTDDFDFKFFGIGVMHDFKQWTPGISHLPFDASAFVGYTQLTAEADLGEESTLAGSDQVAGYEVKSLTLQILASKKLSIFTIYGGFGFSTINSKLKVKGTYTVDGESEITLEDGTTRTIDTSFPLREDPVSLDFSSSGPRATLGFRVKLFVLTIHADYTIQEYNTLTAGIGVSIR